MNITIYLQREEGPSLICTTTLDQFIADNLDGLSGSEIKDIRNTLAKGERYFGGGGASPEWSLKPEF